MKAKGYAHLQQEQIHWAVIDEMELAGDDQQHLRECPVCKRKVEQFRGELQELGQKAEQAVPPFSRPVWLPSEEPVRISRNSGWLPFFGAAAMAGLLVFFYFMSMEAIAPSDLATLQTQEGLLEDEALMRQISEMVENPLSEDMKEISGDNGIGFDDDFLEFVVPDIQDDFQS
jgi:hypothetical protein